MSKTLAHTAASRPLINRELSLLAFNRRVLEMAEDPAMPLLERLRYLCILGSNLDEFFELRLVWLKDAIRQQTPPPETTLSQLRQQLHDISTAAHALVNDQYRALNRSVLPALAEEGIRVMFRSELSANEKAWASDYFEREVRPLLSPIGLDPSHPFPQVENKSLHFIVELSGKNAFGKETSIAIIKAPRVLPRVIPIPAEVCGAKHHFLLLSSIIHMHFASLFPGREILAYSQFRVTRDADLAVGEEEVKNLRQALKGELTHRAFGVPQRLEVVDTCPDHLAHLLLSQFNLSEDDLYRCDGPVNITRFQWLIDQIDVDRLKFLPFAPSRPPELLDPSLFFEHLRHKDVLLHHPYQSFDPVIEFVQRAAHDPDVIAVRQTVYRTGAVSELMETLIEAANRGKEVTVVVELMARFDEAANINWAERLERAGAQVIYGVLGLKTHAKMALLIRRERDNQGQPVLRYYTHLGTGNYHPRTARLYSDFGLLTANQDIGRDVNEVFMHISSLSPAAPMRRLLLAPFTMPRRILAMIRREERHARAGKPAHIIAKMNALLEERIIQALYKASQAGVEIDLIVRGQCALRPGVSGISERIRVRSILGRFLEHHRVWCFENDGHPDVWLSSADWMGRNLFRRIEIAFPVLDPEIRQRVLDEGLSGYLRDNRNAWNLLADGRYEKIHHDDNVPPFAMQLELLRRWCGEQKIQPI
ncbi:MAG: polyphosphate kinase 1 [Burkholderiales bacterium]|jgi:polyphosphate kinase|nr:polyphosphate kinase 1 [Burkholderiales bacterium]